MYSTMNLNIPPRVINRPPKRFAELQFHSNSWRGIYCALLLGGTVFSAHHAEAAAISARVAAVKGHASASAEGGGETKLTQGSTVRAGTVISCGAESGVLLRPAPRVSVVVYMDTKVRFDGADLSDDGRCGVRYSVLSGRALFVIEPEAPDSKHPQAIKVTVTTEEGVIQASKGTWIVMQDENRTAVAVGEGSTDVSIGGGSAASGGAAGGQIEVPEGSVIWLMRQADGRIEAKLVNTETGMFTTIQSDGSKDEPKKAPADLLDQSRQVLDNSGDSTSPATSGSSGSGSGTLTPTSNPDFSTPQPPRPVVSPDTP